MKKFLLVSPKNRTAYNFRGDLIRSIVSQGYEVIVTGPDTTDVEKITALGARFVEISSKKNGTNPITDFKYMLALYRLMKKENIDATLGYTIKPAIYGAIAAKLAKVPSRSSMITGAGYIFISTSIKAKLTRLIGLFLYKLGLSCANHVIFQNEEDRNEFKKLNLVSEKKCAVVNGSGVNMKHFAKVPMPQQICFFMLARALKSKGVLEYLDACRQIKRIYPDVRCMYLGAIEPMQDAIDKNLIMSYVSDGSIEYYGETADVRDFISQCTVFVLPSYREGTPRTVLEAMAMGRPIITTDVPGCRGTVIDSVNGFLVAPYSSEALVEKMLWFIANKDKIYQMGIASNNLCKQKFEVNFVNTKMLQIMRL